MSGHRRYSRRRSSESSTSRTSKRASTADTNDDVPGGSHQRLKRPSNSLPMRVLLNRSGARRDDLPGDSTTAAMSRTSRGEEISVSFELKEPPDTSFLTADLPPTALTTPTIVAAHRDVVLFSIISSYNKDRYPADIVVDSFVYQASRLPSLLLLPSADGPVIYSHGIDTDIRAGLGMMSCTSNDDDDGSSPPFVIAHLVTTSAGYRKVTIDARLFRSESGQWEVFKDLHVHDPNGRREDLLYWTTDEVVRYGSRYLIWVDYYHGMVIMDLSSQLETTTKPPPPPSLRYVPLPVNRVGSPEDPEEHNRGHRSCPKKSRSLCVTRYGIKFVSVDSQRFSNFGIGNRHVLKWSKRFRITTWSLLEDDYTWRMDTRMREEKFWGAFDGGDRRCGFPHVKPKFPVVDVDNPDVIVFQLMKDPCSYRTEWMIAVDMRKKVLLAAIDYSKKISVDAKDIKFAAMKSGFGAIPSELPRYLDAGQACKKRRQ